MKSYVINKKIYIVGTPVDALSISGTPKYPVIIVNDESQLPVDLSKHISPKTKRTPRPPRRANK